MVVFKKKVHADLSTDRDDKKRCSTCGIDNSLQVDKAFDMPGMHTERQRLMNSESYPTFLTPRVFKIKNH